jgi:hypothetical protein
MIIRGIIHVSILYNGPKERKQGRPDYGVAISDTTAILACR